LIQRAFLSARVREERLGVRPFLRSSLIDGRAQALEPFLMVENGVRGLARLRFRLVDFAASGVGFR
jgi:hypothetical protein